MTVQGIHFLSKVEGTESGVQGKVGHRKVRFDFTISAREGGRLLLRKITKPHIIIYPSYMRVHVTSLLGICGSPCL